MELETIVVGPLGVNCYLLWNPATLDALVVDPGDDAPEILIACQRRGVQVRGILLTHAHVDHIRGVGAVAAACHAPVLLAAADWPMYRSPANCLLPWVAAAENLPEPSAVSATLPGLEFETIPTPGHTPGGVCYHFPASGLVLTGDTLFAGSIGRTDFPGGDHETLQRSLQHLLHMLPPLTRVFPGHGEPTTIGDERRDNPFLDFSG